MPKSKKLVFNRTKSVELIEADPGAVAADELLVRSEYTLISPGTELAIYDGTHIGFEDPANQFAKYPFFPGYAAAGEVEEVGGEVEGFEPGDLVYAIGPHAERFRVKAGSESAPVFKLSESVPSALAPFARIAGISMTALLQTGSLLGERALVLGLGLVGNLAAQLYAASGMDPIGVDVAPNRLEIAKACGIRDAICSGPRLEEAVAKVCPGGKPALVVEATGIPALVSQALALVRPMGQVALLGSTRGTVELDVYRQLHRSGVKLVGAHEGLQKSGGFASRRSTTQHALRLIERGALKIEPLLTDVFPPEQAEEAYEMLLACKDACLGALFDWRGR